MNKKQATQAFPLKNGPLLGVREALQSKIKNGKSWQAFCNKGYSKHLFLAKRRFVSKDSVLSGPINLARVNLI